MKTNIFVRKENGGWKSVGLSEGEGDGGLEDILIQQMDETKMTREQIIVSRFHIFLGNQRLNIEKLLALPKEEQDRLRREFLGE